MVATGNEFSKHSFRKMYNTSRNSTAELVQVFFLWDLILCTAWRRIGKLAGTFVSDLVIRTRAFVSITIYNLSPHHQIIVSVLVGDLDFSSPFYSTFTSTDYGPSVLFASFSTWSIHCIGHLPLIFFLQVFSRQWFFPGCRPADVRKELHNSIWTSSSRLLAVNSDVLIVLKQLWFIFLIKPRLTT